MCVLGFVFCRSTVSESLPSPPVSAVQSHRLPQIHSESQEQEHYAPISRLVQVTSHTSVTESCRLLICLIWRDSCYSLTTLIYFFHTHMQYITIQTSGVSKICLLFEINVYIHSAKMQWISIKKYKLLRCLKIFTFFFKESWIMYHGFHKILSSTPILWIDNNKKKCSWAVNQRIRRISEECDTKDWKVMMLKIQLYHHRKWLHLKIYSNIKKNILIIYIVILIFSLCFS